MRRTFIFLNLFVSSLLSVSTLNAQGFLGPDVTLNCGETTTELDAGSGYNEYKWSNNQTTQKITVGPGSYWAERRTVGTGTTTVASSTTGSTSHAMVTGPGQSFTANATGYLKTVSYMQYPSGGYTTNFQVFKGAGFDTVIASLSSVAVPSAAANQWFTFTLTTPVLIYKDSVYTWRIDTGGSTNVMAVSDNTNPYPGGTYLYMSFGKVTPVAGTDLNFKADVTPVAAERDTITVAGLVCNGTTRPKEILPLKVYPNPVAGKDIHIEGDFVKATLRSAQGTVLNLQVVSGEPIELPRLQQGLYILQVEDKEGRVFIGKLTVE